MKKGKEWIYDSFEDKRKVVIIGLASFFYLIYYSIAEIEATFIGKIIPPWPLPVFLFIGILILGYQLFVWKILKHFENKWYRYPLAWLYFFCEFNVIFIALCFLTWPFYGIFHYFTTPPKTIY